MKANFSGVTRALSKQTLIAKQNSPHIMFGVGIAGVVAGTVLACRATLKMHDLLDEHQQTLDDINQVEHKDYSEKDRVQDKAVVYTKLTLDVVKLYGPAFVVGGLGIACLAGSHNTLTKRNAALTAAYAGLERTYNAYRQRVATEIGEDKERELHYEVANSTLKAEMSEKRKNGGLKRAGDYSVYSRFFDESNLNWKSAPEHNKFFLRCQQTYANDLLRARGHLFLNEVYDMLGMDRTKAGAVVGWMISDEGDNYVDFGIFDPRSDAARAFVNGWENNVLLDFNVDGVIYDKIEKRK